ncbi:xanthine dehydrogenase family protein molybdopterin-binding subunit [Ramlibacter sp. GTP1]|uniref:Xanthine dehydrogenase family protein molybdopterin-binding subunit n=2 Tax=Ramlibacter albus TaxID=2079448 RepID=A0A923S4V5_9BURK|nr:xanthine dehydrogenase family protein molybdopterin-binding subunit [Ramlibacter albus]MBC5768004.1 xanthine dehydrogenase family protein molybdopterin-binding subunit [Ramlibacter albus]
MTDPAHHPSKGRREDARLTTGRGEYTDDVECPGALHTFFVRSPYPSATVRSIDAASALAQPDVVAVLTGADFVADGFVDCPAPFRFPQGDGTEAVETPRQLLVRDRVRFAGEPVAMVLARSFAAAQDAAELVMVDYEEHPCVTQPADTPLVWDDRPGNIAYHWRHGDAAGVDAALAASAHVARLTSKSTRVAAMAMEPRSALAYTGEDGRTVMRLSHQGPHQFRDELAKRFGLPPTDIRVVIGDVGGSFGMKSGALREEVLVFWAARRMKQPVRWTATRAESFLSDEHGRDIRIHTELGLDAAGRFTALRVRYDVNVGAYMNWRSTSPVNNIGGISGVYATPVTAAEVRGWFTNTQPTAPYRGAGRPDATYVIERIIDVAAAEMGIDPAELRRRNLIPASAMPYRTSFRFEYDCGEFERNLDKAMELAKYAQFPQRRDEARQRGMLRGIGIAMPIEMAGGLLADNARLTVNTHGTVTLRVGSVSVGQGHETGFSRLVADALGIPIENVRYEQGDTDLLAVGRGNGGSSALIQGGSALRHASENLIENARKAAARKLEAHADDIEFVRGRFQVRGTDHGVALMELAREGEALEGTGAYKPERPTFPNGCHICEVEIDPATGQVKPVLYVSVEDVGRVMNPVMVEGQIHGGVAQGLGQVLMEEIRYDEYGQLLTGSFMDYAMPRADDMPPMVSANVETPTALNPLGVKGVGEAGTVGAMSATMNAVCNALQPEGVRHLDMPATPARVWHALQAATGSRASSA